MKRFPHNKRVWVYGVLLPMMDEPSASKSYGWHKARWVNPAEDDDGGATPGYWDPEFNDMWVRNPVAWMFEPSEPDRSSLVDYIANVRTEAASESRRAENSERR